MGELGGVGVKVIERYDSKGSRFVYRDSGIGSEEGFVPAF